MEVKQKIHVKKGDRVEVITGKDRGKRGKVIAVFAEKSKVVVEGVARVKKHVKASQKSPQGGIIDKEMPVHTSNVMLVCPACGEATRSGARHDDEGKKIRVCKSCSEDIDRSK